MKKLILVAAIATFPLVSMATNTTICDGGTPTSITGVDDGTKFIQVTLNPQCSANTIVVYDQGNTAAWGGSGSKKGKNTFLGSTNGGAVKAHSADCGTDGCNATEAGAAATAAASITGS